MQQKISPFCHTQQEFANQMASLLGRGKIHAELIYKELFRYGNIQGRHPAFNNSKTLLQEMLNLINIELPSISNEKHDGKTGKFLLKTDDQYEVESVLIPMQAGGTLCVSSQVGCRMGCTFCETGRMGLLRSLRVEEIVSQIFIARHIIGFDFRNVVFMGMGEPFDHYDAVMKAVRILYEPQGFGFGQKQITISTSGCVDGIERLTEETGPTPNLAVSINAPEDTLRDRLMPVNRKYNLATLRSAMDLYCSKTGRSILVAYVLMKGVNDSLEQAEQLAIYLKGADVKINLIPYNPQSCDRYQASEMASLEAFAHHLRNKGFYTLLRLTKGQEIMAACGQLGNVKLRQELRAARNSLSIVQS